MRRAQRRNFIASRCTPNLRDGAGALCTSLNHLLSYFIPNGYSFYHERTQQQLPSTAKELQRLIASGQSVNIVARVA
ncbi:MAG TPA: hypothetical protein VHS31_15080 [Tepidisphaeraceae bacterium]|jgi:hypothetical protein|nr:hypothetical protein [Tepidisphaeraceae bacterium]